MSLEIKKYEDSVLTFEDDKFNECSIECIHQPTEEENVLMMGKIDTDKMCLSQGDLYSLTPVLEHFVRTGTIDLHSLPERPGCPVIREIGRDVETASFTEHRDEHLDETGLQLKPLDKLPPGFLRRIDHMAKMLRPIGYHPIARKYEDDSNQVLPESHALVRVKLNNDLELNATLTSERNIFMTIQPEFGDLDTIGLREVKAWSYLSLC